MSHLRALLLAGLALCSVRSAALETQAPRLKVLTSFLPVYCFTVNVAGDLAEVENLLPARVEPHDYQFSRKDVQKLARADLIVINGLGLEKWLDKPLENSASAHPRTVVAIAAGLETELISSAKPSALPNPHIWLDPRLACHAVTNILRALQQADPAHANGYAANAMRYLARLEQLDAALHRALAPVREASIVTYHDAFAYLARRYGLHVLGVIEPVPDLEPSLKYLAVLYRSIRASHVEAIFTEPPAPARLARQIGSDLHLPLAQLDTLETGPLNPSAYEDAMQDNLRVLARVLQPHAQETSP